jgi:hypothetical protein
LTLSVGSPRIRGHEDVDARIGSDRGDGQAFACTPSCDSRGLPRPADENHDLAGMGQSIGADRNAVRRRLGGIVHGERDRVVHAFTPNLAWEETRRVAVLAKTEQHQIERSNLLQGFAVSHRSPFWSQLRRYLEYAACRQRDAIQQRNAGHDTVSLRVVDWKTPFVPEENHPSIPGALQNRQTLVNGPRRRTPGQHDIEFTARQDRMLRDARDGRHGPVN